MRIATNSSKIDISKEKKTASLAKIFSKLLNKGDVVFLYGEIGAGKTTFVRYLINHLQKRSKKSLSEVTSPIEKAGLIVTDIEVLRLHYTHTLKHWKENCLKNKDKIIQMFDEKFFRMWEFYLAGCEMAFKWGDQVVYQFQLTKNYSSTPVTRDYIYQ